MAPKLAVFLLSSLLLVTAGVSSSEKNLSTKVVSPAPATAPISPAPVSSNHSNPPSSPVSAPNITHVDVKECPGLCLVRCAKHSRPNLCHRACGSCCMTCRCVPPGTFGNREMCGTCYTGATTHGNRTKCP